MVCASSAPAAPAIRGRERVDADQPRGRPAGRCARARSAVVAHRLQRQRRTANAPARRASRNSDEQHHQAVGVGACGRRGRTRTGPSSGPMTTPCRPSAPPVSQSSLVGELVEHQRDAERDHQPRQVGAAQDQRRWSTQPEQRPAAPTPTSRPTQRVAASRAWRTAPPRRRRSRRRRHGRATRCRHSRGSGRATARTAPRIAISLSSRRVLGQQQRRRGSAASQNAISQPAPARVARAERAAARRRGAAHHAPPCRANRPCGRSSRIDDHQA